MATADSHEAPASLTAAAVRGSVLNTGQWVANKVATAAAMLLIARMLRPEEYGVATQALAIAQFLVVLTPVSVGDVLIAHPSRLEMLAPSARALALRVGLAMAGVVLVSIPVVVSAYSRYPALALGGLVALLSIRPLLDALTVVPVSRLRIGLQYRRIALVDGLVQLAMTGVSLAMAAFGGRGASLVAPQLIGTGVRALVYGRSAADRPGARVHGWAIRALWRSLLPAALAQYVHNVVVLLEILVLGLVSGELQTGLFGFAFLLAAQANGVIAYQLAVVLQPIFGRLQDDPARQRAGFLRAQRALAALCIPLSVTQAVVAEPLFRAAFDPRWEQAVPVFQAISLGQTFYFASSASISCLRAQRRFATFFRWQCIQGVLSIPLYVAGAYLGGAIGVAIASGIGWGIGSPCGVWLCLRGSGRRSVADAVLVFARPWAATAIPAVGGWMIVRQLGPCGIVGDLVTVVGVGALVLGSSVALAASIDPEVRGLLVPRLRKLLVTFAAKVGIRASGPRPR